MQLASCSYGVSIGLVPVKRIAVFITHAQYFVDTGLSNIRRGNASNNGSLNFSLNLEQTPTALDTKSDHPC